MAKIDQEYHKLLEAILNEGYTYEDPNRKDVYRTEIPSYTFRHEFKNGFPAITTKELNYNNIIVELLWFLKGDTNIKYLVDNRCNIWNKDAYKYYQRTFSGIDKETDESYKLFSYNDFIQYIKDNELCTYTKYQPGNLGPVYGHQWRNFNGVDQISKLVKGLKEKPLGTEHIVNSWNASDIPDMALPPCHYGFQIVVKPLWNKEYDENLLCLDRWFEDSIRECEHGNIIKVGEKFFEICFGPEHDSYNKTSGYGFELHWTQRSVDTFLGLPYNIASYASLALILEKITGYKALAIQGDLKKVHLYDNSLEGVKEQLSRNFSTHGKCELNGLKHFGLHTAEEFIETIDFLKPSDISLKGYNSYPAINVTMLERNE